jgi:hypothetical protein
MARPVFSAALLLCLAAGAASATTISLSTVSSDGTPASQLDADLDFSVTGSTLTLTVTNTGTDGFNINHVYFNGSSIVTGLSLVSATHSAAGDVLADWNPVETNKMADGFGSFDFALTDGVGETNVAVIEDGESIVFVLTISGSGGYVDGDFIQQNAGGYTAAAFFTNGPEDPEKPGDEDSAFGAVPEPTTTALLAAGFAGLAYLGRRRF